jgi:hypothetical protein
MIVSPESGRFRVGYVLHDHECGRMVMVVGREPAG